MEKKLVIKIIETNQYFEEHYYGEPHFTREISEAQRFLPRASIEIFFEELEEEVLEDFKNAGTLQIVEIWE